MAALPQHPYFIPRVRMNLITRKEVCPLEVPSGGRFLLQYLLVYYVNEFTEVDPVHLLTPPLFLRILTLGGQVFHEGPAGVALVTSPGAGLNLDAVAPINYLLDPKESFLVEITGQDGTRPGWVSLTAMGIREEGRRAWQ